MLLFLFPGGGEKKRDVGCAPYKRRKGTTEGKGRDFLEELQKKSRETVFWHWGVHRISGMERCTGLGLERCMHVHTLAYGW